jgi:hypothetical protein
MENITRENTDLISNVSQKRECYEKVQG